MPLDPTRPRAAALPAVRARRAPLLLGAWLLAAPGLAAAAPRENVLMAFDPVRGSGHGSHHDYDTHVPLIFWGGPFAAGERTTAATPYDLAPTLADLLGITLPDATGSSRAGAAQ